MTIHRGKPRCIEPGCKEKVKRKYLGRAVCANHYRLMKLEFITEKPDDIEKVEPEMAMWVQTLSQYGINSKTKYNRFLKTHPYLDTAITHSTLKQILEIDKAKGIMY